MTIQERIKKVLKLKNISQKEFADRLGYSVVYISDLLRGKKGKGLKVETLEQIARALDVPVGYFFGEVELEDLENKFDIAPEKIPEVRIHYGNAEELKESTNIQDYAFIPLMESKVAATPDVLEIATDNIEGWACIHTSQIPKTNKSLFAFRVAGESMLPELRPNDIVAVLRYEFPPDFESITMQNIYLVRMPDDFGDYGLALKRVEIGDEKHVILISDNPKYPPKLINLEKDEGFKIIGKVVWMWREYGGEEKEISKK